MLEKKYLDILERIVKAYKDFEHEKLKEVKGTELDKFIQDTEDYLKRLKELRKQIEKRSQEKTIEQIYEDVVGLLGAIVGKKTLVKMVPEFEGLVKKGNFTAQHLRILKNIIHTRVEFKKGKLNAHKIEEARRNASILINDLIDYSQRAEMASIEKSRMRLKYKKAGKGMVAELLHFNGVSFLFAEGKIKKITDRIEESNTKEVSGFAEGNQGRVVEVNPRVFEFVKKELGNFEISL